MKIENIEVYGFRAALRGMRNPMNSWSKSDSHFNVLEAPVMDGENKQVFWNCYYCDMWVPEYPFLGPKDLKLACKLIKGGSEHRKFIRQIMIWFDITIPRYIWQELDTYKVATVRNSCSTMHKLGVRDLTQEDFEEPILEYLLTELNSLGQEFRVAKAAKNVTRQNEVRRKYKNWLPEGFLQKATYSMNYETALSMYFQRKDHRLSEWRADNPESICSMIASLPYMKEFIEAK